jgi:hypothetical protein
MLSTGPSQCGKDLEKCRTDLATRQACETCPGNLENCQRDCATRISAERATCAAQVSAQQTSCAASIQAAAAAATARGGQTCAIMKYSATGYQSFPGVDLAGCKARCLTDSRCLSYSANMLRSIYGCGYIGHYCHLYEKATKDLPASPNYGAISMFDRSCPDWGAYN